MPNLLRPYPGDDLGESKRIYKYRLYGARRIVENAFGILASRFRCFRRPLLLDTVNAMAVVKGAVMLHNFLRKEAPLLTEASVPLTMKTRWEDCILASGEEKLHNSNKCWHFTNLAGDKVLKETQYVNTTKTISLAKQEPFFGKLKWLIDCIKVQQELF